VSEWVKVSQLCLIFAIPWTIQPMEFYTGQNTGVCSCSLLQGIFSTQGSNPGFLYCRRILYQLSHQGSPIKFWNRPPFQADKKFKCQVSWDQKLTLKKAKSLQVRLNRQKRVWLLIIFMCKKISIQKTWLWSFMMKLILWKSLESIQWNYSNT